MTYHLPYPTKYWAGYRQDLAEQFRIWGVRDFEILCIGAGSEKRDQPREDRRVTIKWRTPGGQLMQLAMDRQPNALDNLRVLLLAIEALRLNEKRGISETLQEAYAQIAAPKQDRDPWEVLDLRPGADETMIKAAYRAKAKLYHPDTNAELGDEARFTEVTRAYMTLLGEAA